MDVKIITLNVRGLRGKDNGVPKRRKVFSWLKKQRADIFLLQETHSDERSGAIWLREWGGLGFLSHGDNSSCGAAVLIKPGLNIEIRDVKFCKRGRFVVVAVSLNGSHVTLASIYGPNTDDPSVFQGLFEVCELIGDSNLIIGGDFNFRFDLTLDHDSRARRIANNQRCRATVLEYMTGRKLLDIWRTLHPNVRNFTYHQAGSRMRSRIDFFLISDKYMNQTQPPVANILDGYLSDHKMCTIEIHVGEISLGKSFWKFNNTLLLDDSFVAKAREKITEILIDNDTEGTSRCLLLQTLLCVLRGWIIKMSSHKKREQEKRLHELDEHINRLSASESIANVTQLRELKMERDTYITDVTRGNVLRCRANWRQYGEKGTKYFHGLVKRNAYRTVFESMELCHTNPGNKTADNRQMLNECVHFFEQLYSHADNGGSANDILSILTPLNSHDAEQCEGEITETELARALADMKMSTSPGPDGFTVPFFKCFWNELKDIIVSAFNEIYTKGHMPGAMKRSITILLPKKNKDRNKVSSLRPISLLNVLYKLITKMLATRMRCVIEKLINPDQTGFIKGRYIGENVRLIIDTLQAASAKQLPGLIVFCDWKQAYDTVNWKFLKQALVKYGFGSNMRKWIDIIYDERTGSPCTAQVQLNGHLSQHYRIERGLRQGCPLSCYLFLLSIEPLAEMIRLNENVKGLTVNGTELKISSYADDTTIILDGSPQSLRECMRCIKSFQEVSGLHLNNSKTQAVWIGADAGRNDSICPEIEIQWTSEPVEYLGIRLNATGTDLPELNYPDKISRLKQKLSPWQSRGLTAYGKTHLLRSEALSQLVYTMTLMEKPNRQQLKQIDSIMFKFIWKNKRDKIKRSILKSSHSKGGLKVPDPSLQADSLKTVWIKKAMDENCNAKWKAVMKDKLFVTDSVSIFRCDMSQQQALQHFESHFWAEVFLTWSSCHQQSDRSASEALSTVLWKNKNMCLERKKILPVRKLIEQGVIRVADLYRNGERRLMTVVELREKYRIGNFLIWQAILRSIPRAISELITQKRPRRSVSPKVFEELASQQKPAKWAYKKLLQQFESDQMSIQQRRWQTEINGEPLDWTTIYSHVYSVTDDFELRWFQYQLLQRILPTNRLLYLYQLIDSDECVFCPGIKENITHSFWDCRLSKQFWAQLKSLLGLRGFLSLETIITGVYRQREDISSKAIMHCVLLAKRFIWRSRKAAQPPNIHGFTLAFSEYIRVERYVALVNRRMDEFLAKWSGVMERVGVG